MVPRALPAEILDPEPDRAKRVWPINKTKQTKQTTSISHKEIPTFFTELINNVNILQIL